MLRRRISKQLSLRSSSLRTTRGTFVSRVKGMLDTEPETFLVGIRSIKSQRERSGGPASGHGRYPLILLVREASLKVGLELRRPTPHEPRTVVALCGEQILYPALNRRVPWRRSATFQECVERECDNRVRAQNHEVRQSLIVEHGASSAVRSRGGSAASPRLCQQSYRRHFKAELA
jgi:hypothetical protein